MLRAAANRVARLTSLTRPRQSKRMFDAVSSSDKSYVSYPGGFHELFTEPEGMGEKATNVVTAWITERAAAASKL